jgi:hypothetical protein
VSSLISVVLPAPFSPTTAIVLPARSVRQMSCRAGVSLARVGEADVVEGQLRGEVRADEPAESLAVILLYAVLFSARRAVTIGRPPGSTALSRLALQVTLRGMRP